MRPFSFSLPRSFFLFFSFLLLLMKLKVKWIPLWVGK
jgi:hypothetical protein